MDDLIAHIRKGAQVDGKITLYAHSLAGRPQSEWQTLREHSCNVAEVAARFAQPGIGRAFWVGCMISGRLVRRFKLIWQRKMESKMIASTMVRTIPILEQGRYGPLASME